MGAQTLVPLRQSIKLGSLLRVPTMAARCEGELGSKCIAVVGTREPYSVKLASTRQELAEAFRMVADNYQAKGYDKDGIFRFTPYHALPDTATFVAKNGARVVATMSLVADNTLLGLPLERVYATEVQELRRNGRRLGEVVSLVSTGLPLREFTPVFHALIRLMKQYHLAQGGNAWVITVNPRHRAYYSKVLGYNELGPRCNYASVQNHPAEAYWVDLPSMKSRAPTMYRRMFGTRLPATALVPAAPHPDWVRHFGGHSTQTDGQCVEAILQRVARNGSPRRW